MMKSGKRKERCNKKDGGSAKKKASKTFIQSGSNSSEVDTSSNTSSSNSGSKESGSTVLNLGQEFKYLIVIT